MSVLAFSKKSRAYIPESCKKDESPATFEIRRLDQLEIFDIMERHNLDIDMGAAESKTMSAQEVGKGIRVMLAYLELGLSGWSNVMDEDGPLEFSIDNMRCLHPATMSELSREIQGVVSEEEAKNSEPSSE